MAALRRQRGNFPTLRRWRVVASLSGLAIYPCAASLTACAGDDAPVEFGPSTGGAEGGGGRAGEPTETLACEPAELCAPAFTGGEACDDCTIDDFEDGDGLVVEADGRHGPWYGYERAGSIEPVGTPIEPARLPESRDGSRTAMHVAGRNEGLVLLGVDLVKRGDEYGTYDASAHRGITFWLKNESGKALQLAVLVATEETTRVAFGGQCDSGCDAPYAELTVRGSGWTPITLPWSALEGGTAPFSPRALTHLQFVPGPGKFDFWLDDASFF